MRCAICVVIVALTLLQGFSARAQVEKAGTAPAASSWQRWLVLPVRGGDADEAGPASIESLHTAPEALRRELLARGNGVWRGDRASERYEAVGSAPAPEVSQSDIDRWVERSRAAVRYLARADYKAARRELKAAQRLANRAAEELNREAARAQQVLDTCLFMVRAYVETEKPAEARRQARECRQMVPRVEPTAFRHTPEVRALLARVDAEIAAEAPGMLSITSTPAGCLARVNGVELGRTPMSRIELPVGTYRIQVECEEGRRGRIHRVAVRSGDNAFAFDASLERAVRTRPVLYLEYASLEAWRDRMTHADRVARTLGGTRVLAVSDVNPNAVRIDLHAAGYAPASAWLTTRAGAPSTGDLGRALDALLEGRSVDFTEDHPIARSSWEAVRRTGSTVAVEAPIGESGTEPSSSVPRPRRQRIAGWTLFGAGMASIGASVGLHVWRGTLGDDFVAMPASLSAAQRWQDARIGVWTTAAFGGVTTSAAMPLLLPDYGRTPWWGWTMGALGLGLTGYAIYEGVVMTSCADSFVADVSAARACVARGQEAGRIALTLAGAAPLLTAPLVYLFRPLRAEPSVSATGNGAIVRVRKAF